MKPQAPDRNFFFHKIISRTLIIAIIVHEIISL